MPFRITEWLPHPTQIPGCLAHREEWTPPSWEGWGAVDNFGTFGPVPRNGADRRGSCLWITGQWLTVGVMWV